MYAGIICTPCHVNPDPQGILNVVVSLSDLSIYISSLWL
jgi:hypothetical protein